MKEGRSEGVFGLGGRDQAVGPKSALATFDHISFGGGAGAGPLVTRWRGLTVARKFHDNAVTFLAEGRAAEIPASDR